MISQSFAQTASGLYVPRSNGYANRLIRDQLGSGTVTLPSWATKAKLALLGAGASGAVTVQDGSSSNIYPVSAGGGGALILATLDLDVVGRSFNYVLGAGGLSVLQTTAGATAGNSGAISSVVWGSRTFTANPGQAGRIGGSGSDLTALPGGLGGSGTGGDFNFSGGPGGAFAARSQGYQGALPGGGTSGRPNGDGLRGGQISDLFDKSGVFACLPGSSWGFFGDVPLDWIGSTGWDTQGFAGPGVLGAVEVYNRPGAGEGSLNLKSPYADADIITTPGQVWWDLADIAGWGGAIVLNSSNAIPIMAGPGGAGMGGGRRPIGNLTATPVPAVNGGFGAGGGAGQTRWDSSNNLGGTANGGNGGRGAGGAPAFGRYANPTYFPARSGKGGDAWLGVWFN